MNLMDSKPIISTDVFLAPSAAVIGNVELSASSSVWYGAVIRGDTGPIHIGERAAVQDRAVVHAVSRIGDGAVLAPGAIVDSASVSDGAYIGPAAIVGKGASVGAKSVVSAGSHVEPGTTIGDGELWSGVPAVKERMLTEAEIADLEKALEDLGSLASAHMVEAGKTHEQIEAEKLRYELLNERSEDYNSHLGLLGREEEIVEEQAKIVEEDRRLQRQAGGA